MDQLSSILAGISVNTQSSVRITDGTRVVYVDPLDIPGAPHDADAVFVTHAHGDHFSPADIAKTAKDGTVLVLPGTMADRAGEVLNAAEDIPKSFVVCRDGEKTGVYLSQMAAATLLRRAESGIL